MIVNKLMLIRTGQFHEQLMRPYTMHTDGELHHQLVEATQNGSRIAPNNLSGIAGQILRPSSSAVSSVEIANGWAEPRMRFLMEVHHPTMDGNVEIQYITGFTDHYGASQSGHIDPKMHFYINNTITTRLFVQNTHYGQTQGLRLKRASHVMSGPSPKTLDSMQTSRQTMRPEDVVGTVATLHNEYADFGINVSAGFGPAGYDSTHMKLSDRSHGLPSRYLSNMFKGYRAAVENSTGDEDYSKFIGNIVGFVRDDTPTSDRFIGNMVRHGLTLSENSFFTYADLLALDPNVPQRTELIMSREVQQQAQDFRQYTSDMYAPTHQVIIATMLSHSLPALMTELMLTNAAFIVTNRTLDGQPMFTPLGGTSFANVDLTPFLQQLELRFLVEIWRDLTRNGMIDLELQIEFSLLGNSKIKVSYMGEAPQEFVIPSFSDGLLAPVLTNNYQMVKNMAQEVDTLANTLQTDLSATSYAPETHRISVPTSYSNSAAQPGTPSITI